jgi:hypothetical protein
MFRYISRSRSGISGVIVLDIVFGRIKYDDIQEVQEEETNGVEGKRDEAVI